MVLQLFIIFLNSHFTIVLHYKFSATYHQSGNVSTNRKQGIKIEKRKVYTLAVAEAFSQIQDFGIK